MIYVLYKNSGVHSGRALRQTLDEELPNTTVRGGFPSHLKACVKKSGAPKLIINLGTTEDLPCKTIVLNDQNKVRAAANKRSARIAFEKQEVPAPNLFTSPNQVSKADLPVIGRTSYHSKGKGFWFCQTMNELNAATVAGATHFLQFIGDTREYRVHTFLRPELLTTVGKSRGIDDYLSVKISEKVWVGKGAPPANVHQKNHEFGWTFLGQQNRRDEELDLVRMAAKKAAAALEMDFGAVDVMYNIPMKTVYVLEVNSTPSLADEQSDTRSRYAARFGKILDKLNGGSA